MKNPIISKMSKRRVEILTMIAQGLEQKEIAHKLIVAESTIAATMKSVRHILQANNTTHAVYIWFVEYKGGI